MFALLSILRSYTSYLQFVSSVNAFNEKRTEVLKETQLCSHLSKSTIDHIESSDEDSQQ